MIAAFDIMVYPFLHFILLIFLVFSDSCQYYTLFFFLLIYAQMIQDHVFVVKILFVCCCCHCFRSFIVIFCWFCSCFFNLFIVSCMIGCIYCVRYSIDSCCCILWVCVHFSFLWLFCFILWRCLTCWVLKKYGGPLSCWKI